MYTFLLLDSNSDLNIVQIFNKQQTHLFATIVTGPDYRLQPTGRTVITFAETSAGNPLALRAWFYPGDPYGQQFVYPKSRVVETARRSNHPVLSMADTMASNISKLIKSEKFNGQEVGIKQVVGEAPQVASNSSAKR